MTAPGTSKRPLVSSSRDSGTCSPISTTRAHSGRLIAKIQRQPACSTRNPPRNGPTAAAIPETPAQVPMAAARSSRRKLPWMIASAPGASSAAATPCSTRKATSCVGDWANAHSALPSAKPTTPTR